ncbi:tetratricopeptide repeat protein [Bordetella petrii]|uniref:O-linked N-acetylglucosamine transferase, SPINDLY family protein n=1 Tax=Bordetella petrii TaxID=94624 RepID=UPI001E40280A|nr:glycosyltransferase family 41 protein [Bordetella petrii]MCD0501970.1 tetratricopeptide repeat protein [Bordetella petrii]
MPRDASAWQDLARHLGKAGSLEQARQAIGTAIDLDPDDAGSWEVLAKIEIWATRDDLAAKHYQHALTLNEGFPDAHQGLSEIAFRKNDNQAALAHADRVLEQRPHDVAALSRKVQVLSRLFRYQEAAELCSRLIRQDPKNRYVHWNDLGNIKRDLGLLDEAVGCYETAASFTKTDPVPLSNWLTLSHYIPHRQPEEILELCKRWAAQFAPDQAAQRPVPADRSAGRPLRLGMYSDGFRQHPVGAMTTPALEHLVKLGIEIYAYTTSNVVDSVTTRLKAIAKKWTPIATLRDEQLAQLVRKDQIDILMDLSGHNAGNRIRTMTLGPAPVLVKWVGGLINTTGVESIDYLLSDGIESPPGSDTMYTEKLIRMPDDYICYMPPARVPDVGPLPALKAGHITFGCFNNPTKINEVILAQWARLLHAVPGSRLFLKGGAFGSDDLCQRTLDVLADHGITPDRVRLEGHSKHYELFSRYNEVDIALDPWPYSGGLTTCEAMLMGVPVVTLPGPTFAGRHSATHLVNAGMPELVAEDWDQYHARALELVSDLQSLATIRSHLRQILLDSPVCNGPKFARHLADALRAIWQRYCEGKPPAALAFTPQGQPWFEDDDAPMTLTHPEPEPDAEARAFHFAFEGRIVTVDHGGVLVRSTKFPALHKLGALSTVAIDPASTIANAERLKQENALQHYQAHFVLADGEPTVLHACLDAALSGTLEPLPAEQQPAASRTGAAVLAKLPISSACLDGIDGLDRIDWLVLDDAHDNLKLLRGAATRLSDTLLVQVRIRYAPLYRNQPSLEATAALLAAHGLSLLRLDNAQYALCTASDQLSNAGYDGSQLLAADAIFVPDGARLQAMDDNRRLKLAFIAQAGYGLTDYAFDVLKRIDADTAQHFLDSLDTLPNGARLPAPAAAAAEPRPEARPMPVGRQPVVAPPLAPVDIAKLTETIPLVPHMEPEGRALLEECLARASIFLEYGSGGSSVMAAGTGVRKIYSVDSDQPFLKAVQARIQQSGGDSSKYVPIYINIGPTGAWGRPSDRASASLWPAYASEPWSVMGKHQQAPDLILIDGRFRVASFLASVLFAPVGCTILFDDYFDRPGYHVVEQYLKPIRAAGRMAQFVVGSERPQGLVQELLRYCTDPA